MNDKRNDKSDSARKAPEQPEPKAGKKPYAPPAWEIEEVFERAALGCNKADEVCMPGPVQS